MQHVGQVKTGRNVCTGSQNRVWFELKSYSSACPSPSHSHEVLENAEKKVISSVFLHPVALKVVTQV